MSKSFIEHVIFLFCVFLLCPTMALASSTDIQQGLLAYKELEFEKAGKAFQKALDTKGLSKKDRLQALRYLAICQYNQGEQQTAAKTWKQAMSLDRTLKLPSGQAPSVVKFFEALRPNPPKRIIKRPVPRPVERRAMLRRITPTQPPPKPFLETHMISVIAAGTGILAATTAGILTGITYGHIDKMRTEAPNSLPHYSSAQTTATGATALWITSGVLTAGAVGLYVAGK